MFKCFFFRVTVLISPFCWPPSRPASFNVTRRNSTNLNRSKPFTKASKPCSVNVIMTNRPRRNSDLKEAPQSLCSLHQGGRVYLICLFVSSWTGSCKKKLTVGLPRNSVERCGWVHGRMTKTLVLIQDLLFSLSLAFQDRELLPRESFMGLDVGPWRRCCTPTFPNREHHCTDIEGNKTLDKTKTNRFSFFIVSNISQDS